jgi:hypothetical protein
MRFDLRLPLRNGSLLGSDSRSRGLERHYRLGRIVVDNTKRELTQVLQIRNVNNDSSFSAQISFVLLNANNA